jgi:hypothetical protein
METRKVKIGNEYYNVERGLIRDIRQADNGTGKYSPSYVQVNLDRSSMTIWGDYHVSIGRNTWTRYSDKNIKNLGNVADKKFMTKDLYEMIKEMKEFI